MRRFLLALPLLVLLSGRAFADCSTLTPNMGLAPCTAGTSFVVEEPVWRANWSILDFNFVSPLGRSGVNVSLGTVPATKGGTGQTTYATGDTLYASATNTLSKLAGNTTTTPKVLMQTGNGTNSAAPVWTALASANLPSIILTNVSQIGGAMCADGQTVVDVGGSSWACVAFPGAPFGTSPGTKTATTSLGADPTTDNCVKWIAGGKLGDSGSACGGGGGGSLMLPFPCQLTAGSTDYCGPATSVGNTTAQAALVPMTAAGSFTKMYCGPSSAPGSGQSVVFTVQVNGTPQSKTCTVSGGAGFQCNDTTNTVTFSTGDNVYVEAVSSASSAATSATCTLS